eukprot:CAMPEP_0181184308 /NCGR_PEP_ID=MMETSP1096-20121128/8895_1 /TAXON_ID=156174 ORGANISM="Chrysochromulina ericina, Strain CCMP281" /NCGR_SAMPLE_ID=MMETSP1096 /ASSEMBLY_ACC=CAM_ASM_000453 /LENGTH=89 /DNA_ID=CAMNT_0023273057 /DNA_START=417 /DNA_END=682 /DNA_ORIENTATION=-
MHPLTSWSGKAACNTCVRGDAPGACDALLPAFPMWVPDPAPCTRPTPEYIVPSLPARIVARIPSQRSPSHPIEPIASHPSAPHRIPSHP